MHFASRSGRSHSRGHLPAQLIPIGSSWWTGSTPHVPSVYGARIVGDRTLRLQTCTVQSARSTYLNQIFRYVLGQAGNGNLALSCEWERRSSGSLWWPCAFSLLGDTSSWCDNGDLRLGGRLACWQASRSRSSSAAAAGWAVLHDGFERLVELSRHGELWCVG